MNPNKRRRLAEEAVKQGQEYFDFGEYHAAADKSLQAAELLKSLKGAEQAYAIAKGRAGMSLCNIGKYKEAINLLEEALPLLRKNQEHPEDAATCYDYLGRSYNYQENYQEAKKLHEKALNIRKFQFGDKHPHVAESLNNLAQVYRAEENYEQAKTLFEQALAILESYDDIEPQRLSVPLNNLAIIYYRHGNYEKAHEYMEKALVFGSLEGFGTNYIIIKEMFRQLEEKLQESERLSDLGNMATGIAHNINNPTGIISLKAQRGLRRLKNGNLSNEEATKLFDGILHETKRLGSIIQKFRDFSKGDRSRQENVSLNELVQRVTDYFEGQFQAHDVLLILELDETEPQAFANQFIIEEVLINLLTNAREEVENKPEASVWVKTSTNAEYSVIQVEDNGDGVPEETQKNLFSPFHSHKAHGTGLGLHFAKSALERISGTIAYQNRSEGGACFTVNLLPPQGENS